MLEGWIKSHRQILYWQHFQEPIVLQVWLAILHSANAKDGWLRGKRVRRGEWVTSTAQIMAICGIRSNNTVIDALQTLEESGEIRRERLGNATKITVCHYSKFQGYADAAQPTAQPAAQPTAQPAAQPTAQPTAHKQEYIEREEVKKEKNINPPTPARAREEDFDFETYGIMQNVKMKPSQYRHLVESYGEETAKEVIDDFSCKLADGSTDSANHFATIVSWLGYRRRMGSGIVPLSSKAAEQSQAAMPPPPPPKEVRELSPDELAIIEEWKAFTSEWREEKEKYAMLNEIAQRHGGIAPELLPKLGMMQWKDKWIFR